MWKPLVNGGDVDGGQVADGEFVESGCDSPVLLEEVDPALDGVAVTVESWVERGWSAAGRATLATVGSLVSRDRDGRFDTASAQVFPVGAGRVGLVSKHTIRADSCSADPDTGHGDGFEHCGELRTVTGLTGGEQQGQGFQSLFAGQVQLGRPPAAAC